MKKFTLFLILFIFTCISIYAQSFSSTQSSATSGTDVTFTAVGEKRPFVGIEAYEFTAITNSINFGETTVTYANGNTNYGYVDATTLTIVSIHNSTNTPTTIKLKVSKYVSRISFHLTFEC